MSEHGIHLFSNGSEFEAWRGRNCARCVKEPSCDLYNALFTDSLTHDIPNGNVTAETAERLGYTAACRGVLGWPCNERQADDGGPKPAAHEVAQAGTDMLPGFDAVALKPDGARYPT